MSAPKTPDDLKDCHMLEQEHYNGGKEFFGYGYRCVEHPRLRRVDKYFRKDRSVQSTWWVDGKPIGDLQAALDAMQTPAEATGEECIILDQIGDDWVEWKNRFEYLIVRGLVDKGMIEIDRGKGVRRRSDA